MPIRWRLTLWFLLILFAILVISDITVHELLKSHLNNEIDDRLRAFSAKVHGTLDPDEVPDPVDYDVIHSKLPPINAFAYPGLYIQVIDRDGNVIAKSSNLGDKELPMDPALVEHGFQGNTGLATVPAGGGTSLRIMVSPLLLPDETLLLEVAESLEPVDTTLGRVRWYLSAVTIGALIVAAIAGIILARRALSPVEQITETARKIEEGGDLARRVEYTGPMDEVGRLAVTFDHMIDHLRRVFESQHDFVADASHELRNPLTVIRGNLDLLKRDLSEEARGECLLAIAQEVEKMTRIINDLLLLAELEPARIEWDEAVSLDDLLIEEYDRARRLNQQHHLILERHESVTIPGDAYKLRRLLSNLIDNAIKYTPDGGTITLSLRHEGGQARLDVADTGIGIPPEQIPHIFNRFYRIDKARARATGGSGLGLAIVKAIAQQHGGHVSVESEPGRGSTFTVWLPLIRGENHEGQYRL